MKKTLCAILAVTMVLSTTVTAFGVNTPDAPSDFRQVQWDEDTIRVNGTIMNPVNEGLDLIQITMPFLANWAAVPHNANAPTTQLTTQTFWGYDIIGSAIHRITTASELPITVEVVYFGVNGDTTPGVDAGVLLLELGSPSFDSDGFRTNDDPSLGLTPLIAAGVLAGSITTNNEIADDLIACTPNAPGFVEYVFTGTLVPAFPAFAVGQPFNQYTSHAMTFLFSL